ncbi:MAG: PilN domain-containing protein [Candidatus Paceibacterota bacterium]|jgi:hypothetical protein
MADFNFGAKTVQKQKESPYSSVGFPWRIFVITLVIFVLSLVIYAGMDLGYKPYLESQLSKVDSDFDALSETFNEQQQKDLLNLYSQLYNIKNISLSHPYISQIFNLLESSLYPTVKLTNLQASVSSYEVRVEGITVDFDTLANQLAALKSHDKISSVSLDTSRKMEQKEGGGVFFSIKIILEKSFFNQPS